MDSPSLLPSEFDSEYITGFDYWMQKKFERKLDTGLPELNTLLEGGYSRGIVTVLFGSRKPIIRLLLNAAINSLLATIDGGMNSGRVVYVDAENAFNPYYLSEKIRVLGYHPEELLKRVDVARCFNWNQVVEVVSEKVPLQKPTTLIVSGYTSMFEYSEKSFGDLQLMNGGIKAIMKYNPVVVLGTGMHMNSQSVPMGGKMLTQFAGILISFVEHERYYEVTLQKHPSLPTNSVRVWKEIASLSAKSVPRSYSKDKALRGKHLTLDSFLDTYSLVHKMGAGRTENAEDVGNKVEYMGRTECGARVEYAGSMESAENDENPESVGNNVENADKFSELIGLNYFEAYNKRNARNL
jgi:hypothetical protein